MEHKPYYYKGRFYNHSEDSLKARFWRMFKTLLAMHKHVVACGGRRKLLTDAKLRSIDWLVHVPPALHSNDLIITWLGHASFLIQVGGFNILTDPVFGEISRLVPRIMRCPLRPQDLPPIDAILLSHNHRDHIDRASLKALVSSQPRIYAPEGNASALRRIGFTAVTELSWWHDVALTKHDQTLQISFLPSSHWTGRALFDTNKSLWGSWMMTCNGRNIYFAGDSALDKHFSDIRERFGAIDVALLPVGPLEPHELIADSHLNAHEAIEAFLALDAQQLIPMHWGTFMFGTDRFLHPIEKLTEAWHLHRQQLEAKMLHVLKCGQPHYAAQEKNFSHDIYSTTSFNS